MAYFNRRSLNIPVDRQETDYLKKHKSALKALKNDHRKQRITPDTSEDLISFLHIYQLNSNGEKCTELSKELPESSNSSFIKSVAIQGHSIINDAFQNELDLLDHDGLKISTTIATPIKSHNNCIIGVFQLANKIGKKYFNNMDLSLMEAISLFFGLGIYNCKMYEDAITLMAKRSVALECLSYHTTASEEETEALESLWERKNDVDFNIHSFLFSDKNMEENYTCLVAMHLIIDMNLNVKFHVSNQKLCRFILSVKRNYRNVLYHNWRHALNVAQTMYAMIYVGNMKQYFNDLEIFALIVACLCHDLDHRGTNNDFQSKVDSPLAKLYSTSTLEHHHFDQCIMILNHDSNNIFSAIDSHQYKRTIKLIEHAILATDLKLYFNKKKQFLDTVERKNVVDWKAESNNMLLRGMMMTACDLAGITKPWIIQREVAYLVAGEFFQQGDMERKLDDTVTPIPMMDRRKEKELPKMQMGFIDFVCMPLYKALADSFEGLKPMLDGVEMNRKNWLRLSEDEKNDFPEFNNDGNNAAARTETAETNKETVVVNDHRDKNLATTKNKTENNKSVSKNKLESKVCTIV